MEKRAILAFALSIFIIIIFNQYFVSKDQKKVAQEPAKQQTAAKQQPIKEKAEEQVAKGTEPAPEKTEIAQKPLEQKDLTNLLSGDKEAKEITVQSELLKIVLTSKGARIKGVFMDKYRDKAGKTFNLVTQGQYGELPLYLGFEDPNLTRLANEAVYTVSAESLALSKSNPTGSITFEYKTPQGISIIKTLQFYFDQYHVDVEIKTKGVQRYGVYWGPGLGTSKEKEDTYSYDGAVAYINEKREEYAPKKITDKIVRNGDIKWIALQNKYFFSALIPKTPVSFAVFDKSKAGNVSIGLEPNNFKTGGNNRFILYVGPKEDKRMESYGVGLEKIIDYGWFSFLSIPLLVALRYINGLVGNYGFAIIIITVLIKLVFYPLTEKSYTSMQAMQKIQPKMKELQNIYKNDKQRLNKEVMNLYKQHKVNPAGGCLPMMIQLPIFIALYEVLLYSLDVRQTDFIFWINDLSAKDPYYILPILMGISMYVQQKMTPSAGDPRFAQVMNFMPIVFTFLFINFPVGLVIYWFVNNVLTIAQQYLIKKRAAQKEAKA